ncbi:PHR1-LIKE 1-like isoform X1 [Chlorella sorokiniana]|uniref:PHR1-LIKE 1-like isoform X1 n=1 Tax=Chlorella sorokiniana TaxID=3076 RepID=A0A2P6TE62_CHLSO|nr:PHR1-LIKE 1-like isoform X1 [Chlorella sorokiniana]|eukprot:PRW20934.1 PHR1-LIKE 1-like isoform X1 [Chlorella sorokiniana]
MQAHMASAACSPADPPFQLNEYYPDGAAGMWQQAAQQPQLAFVPTAADYAAACEPGLAASYPAAAGWQQGAVYLPVIAAGPQPIVPEPQPAPDALGSKKRLRWSAALHARFVDAVKQLGGALQATPKRIQLLMAVPGLSLLHVKSHLQKYRNALADGRPAGPRSRPAGVPCRRRGVMSKRSAANMRSSDSNGGGSGSDGEWEEDAGSGAGSGAGSPTVGLGLGGFPEQLSRRNSKHFRPSQPEEAAAEPAAAAPADTAAAAAQQGAAAAAAAGPALEAGSLGQPLPSLGMGMGSAADFAAVEAELEAALAPVDAQLAAIGTEADGQCATDDEDGALLDLPESLAMLDRQLSREAGAGTPPPGDACPSAGSGGQSSSSGLAMTAAPPLASLASPSTLAGSSAPALPDSGDAAAQQQRSGGSGTGGSGSGASGRGNQRLLEAALRMQLEMQRQLSSTMEAQRQLQKQLEEHGRYIEGLLRSEGALSAKPATAAKAAAPSAKPRAAHRRSGSSCSVARPRTAGGTASPALDASLAHVGGPQPPASLAQLPPLVLPVPPLPPTWHAAHHAAALQQTVPLAQAAVPSMPQQAVRAQQAAVPSMPQQAVRAQQAQHAEGWLDQLLPVDDAQHAEQEAAATQLSPSDVDLLLAADSGSLQQLLQQPCGPQPASQQQARHPAASQFSQRSQLSDGTLAVPSGLQQVQQAQQQQAEVGGDLSACMWDSLLMDTGVLHQLLAEDGQQAA